MHRTSAVLNLPAIAIIAAATALCYKGIKESAIVNTIIVAIKCRIVIAVIVFGAFYVNTANWHPLHSAEHAGRSAEFGWSGILQASAIIFFAYIGFDGVSTVAQEAKDPQRGMPIGMLGSLGDLHGALHSHVERDDRARAVPAAQRRGSGRGGARGAPAAQWLTTWVIWGALFGLTSVIITMIIPQARIWLMHVARRPVAEVVRRGASEVQDAAHRHVDHGSVRSDFRRLLPIGILGELVSIGTLIAFIVVCSGVLVLRYTRPDLPRPFRVPAVWFTSLMGVIFCAGMAASLPDGTWLRLVLWSVIGIVIYLLYGYSHSRLRSPGSSDAQVRLSAGRGPDRSSAPPRRRACSTRRSRRSAAQCRRRERTERRQQSLIDFRIAGHDVRPEGVLVAGRRADATARFLMSSVPAAVSQGFRPNSQNPSMRPAAT